MSNFGHDRERAWVHRLREQGFWAQRAPGSLGVDVIAAAPSLACDGFADLRFYEVKATAAGPYHSFSPADRRALVAQATAAGASAWLVWWPVRAQPRVIAVEDWPTAGVSEGAAA